jgi:MFS family permease
MGGVSAGALYPFLAVVARRELRASPYLIAALGAAWSVGNLFNPLVAHAIRNRVKLPYVVGFSVSGRVLYLLMPLAVVAPTFVALCCVAFAVGALATPAYAAVIRDAYPVERRGALMAIPRVLWVGGMMIGALVAGFALDHVGYRWVFPVAGLIGIVGAATFGRVGVPAAPGIRDSSQTRFWDGFKLILTDRRFRRYAAAFFVFGLGNLLMGPVIPVFQVDVLNIETRWVGYLATTASATSMAGFLCWGRVLDRHGPFRLLLLVLAVAAVFPLTYALAHSVPILLIAAAARGMAMAGMDLAYVNAAMRFGPRDSTASYAALFAFLQALRGIPGPFVGAALNEWIGPRPVFLIALGLWCASALIISVGGRMTGDATKSES